MIRMYLSTLFVLLIAASAQCSFKEHPLSDAFINKINRLQSSWKAGRNFDENTPLQNIKSLLGVKPSNKLEVSSKKVKILKDLPETFDAREQWPNCKSIREIRDQSTCGSCWAFGAVEAMSDKICIYSNASIQVSLSANDLLSCCFYCGSGCEGGDPMEAWDYWYYKGIVSGGGYGTKDGCQSYTFPECEHHTTGSRPPCGSVQPTPPCTRRCDEGSGINYDDDVYWGRSTYYVDVDEVQSEILQTGPVEASFSVYEDFLSYKSGVYQYTTGELLGQHAVKLLGWGVENGNKYWLLANSWNEDWGDKGYFKILRGTNECRIERIFYSGIPRM